MVKGWKDFKRLEGLSIKFLNQKSPPKPDKHSKVSPLIAFKAVSYLQGVADVRP